MSEETRKTAPPYSEEQITHWLAFLARGMTEHDQTIFLIEKLQPSWLRRTLESTVYFLASRMLSGVAVAIATAFIFEAQLALVAGLLSGFLLGLFDVSRLFIHLEIRRKYLRNPKINTFINMVFIGLLSGFIGWFISLSYINDYQGFIFAWAFGALYAVSFGFRRPAANMRNDIQIPELLSWSWDRAFKYGGFGLLFGSMIGSVAELSYRILADIAIVQHLEWWLAVSLFSGLVGMLCGTIFGGLESGLLPSKTESNSGIKLALRNGLFAGIIAALFIAPTGILLDKISGGLLVSLTGLEELSEGSTYGVVSAWLLFLWYGGLDVIQHFLVRFLLWRAGCLPWRLAPFLDYAAEELHFLQKVGGGYIFVHRYLLEHFAAMGEDDGRPRTADGG